MAARFYVPVSYPIGKTIALPEKTAHHASRVLRMREGDSAVLFDGQGNEAQVKLHFFADRTEAEIVSVAQSTTESQLKITLIQALVSQEKLDWILEKTTELGVKRIIITPTERSVTKLDEKRLTKRLEQWKKTVQAACEQCGRSFFSEVIYSPTLQKALETGQSEHNILLAPGSSANLVFQPEGTSITFAVGPEGGFSNQEIELAHEMGYQSTLLGPRILRTETAGLTAVAIAQWQLGDFQN